MRVKEHCLLIFLLPIFLEIYIIGSEQFAKLIRVKLRKYISLYIFKNLSYHHLFETKLGQRSRYFISHTCLIILYIQITFSPSSPYLHKLQYSLPLLSKHRYNFPLPLYFRSKQLNFTNPHKIVLRSTLYTEEPIVTHWPVKYKI